MPPLRKMCSVAFALATLAAPASLVQPTSAADLPPLASLPPVPVPADNPMSDAKVELGKKLFWDGRLSGNGSMGCVVCHQPELGWSTGTAISFGYPGTEHWRNSQTIYNAAYYNKLFWEGNIPSLEAQALAAASGAVAGNGDTSMMEMRLRFVPDYVAAFREMFGTEWPHINDAWKAIAAFQRTIVSDPKKVPFDRYLAGEEAALSDAAKRGRELYLGQANCIACHNGPLASDQRFYNLGVPENPVFRDQDLYQITLRWELYQKGVNEETYRKGDRDLGLFHVTKRPEDKGKFRTASLRELKHTAPYMHNGIFETLAEVVDFYDAGAGDAPNKPAVLKPLGLSEQEKADLVAFLEALSMDEPLIVEAPKLPETQPMAWGR